MVIEEKVKHRLVGLAVILSLGVIFAPAMIRKSNLPIEKDFKVQVKLPPKPIAPDVTMTQDQELFKTVKVAKVDLPEISAEKQLPHEMKAQWIKSNRVNTYDPASVTALEKISPTKPNTPEPSKAVDLAMNQPKKTNIAKIAPQKVAQVKVKPVKKDIYSVQLASFTQLSNAKALVARLQSKGYKANFTKVSGKRVIYKVYAGHSVNKTEIVRLRTQLDKSMQLKGIVVNTGVS